MKKFILVIVCIFSVSALAARRVVENEHGVLRQDLVGMFWRQLPITRFPGVTLPLRWQTEKKYDLKLFQPVFGEYIVTIVELPQNGKYEDISIVSAVHFPKLKDGEIPEHECFYANSRTCDGRVCDGLLIGIITQKRKKPSRDSTYFPTEVWKITTKSLKFEKVSIEGVICKPQGYAG